MITKAKTGTQDQYLSNSGEVTAVHHVTGPKNSAEEHNQPCRDRGRKQDGVFTLVFRGDSRQGHSIGIERGLVRHSNGRLWGYV